MINGNSSSVRVGYAKWMGCDDDGIAYNTSDFSTWTVMYNNSIYINKQNIGLCNMTETEFQQSTGLDSGTIVYISLPNDQELLNKAKQLLWNNME